MMTEIEFSSEPIESIDNIEWSNNNITVSNELLDSLREYLNDMNYNPEFDLNNIINVSNAELDSKLELITNIIRLVLSNKWIEPCGAFDSETR